MRKTIKTLLFLSLTMGMWSCSDDDDEITDIVENNPVAVKAPVVTESEVTESSVTLSWTKSDNVKGYAYTLQYLGSHGQVVPIVPETETTENSVIFSDLKSATKYTFRVKVIGNGTNTLDSEWASYEVTTSTAEHLNGPWVEMDKITYQKHNYMSSYCYINITFLPNDKTDHYYAQVVNGTYFDTEPDNPDFIPNTEDDLKQYLLNSVEVTDNATRQQNYWGREVIVATIGVDAEGNPGKLNWKKVQIPTRSEWLGSQEPVEASQASLRIQYAVGNSAELDGAPENCFAVIYRFEPVSDAKDFRYEDGYHVGDFESKSTAEWTEYFTDVKNANGEAFDGGYEGWISSGALDSSEDGFYYYGVTFFGQEMAGETYELIYLAFDSDAVPGTPGSISVTLPEELPAVTGTTDPAMVQACNKALKKSPRRVVR